MPARSRAQQAAMAIAEHAPGKLQPQNRGLLDMSHAQLHDFAATPTRGLPQYSKFAAGGPVTAPPSYYDRGGPVGYDQGGEVDVSMASHPQMPNTPSMEQNKTVGYARGGSVGEHAAESYGPDIEERLVTSEARKRGIPAEQMPRLLRAIRDRGSDETRQDVIERFSLPSERYAEPQYGRGGVVGKSKQVVRGLPRYIGRYAGGGDVAAEGQGGPPAGWGWETPPTLPPPSEGQHGGPPTGWGWTTPPIGGLQVPRSIGDNPAYFDRGGNSPLPIGGIRPRDIGDNPAYYARGGPVGGKLSAGQRKALPRSDFAVPSKAPGSGSYPMPDRSHAANAKARASQFGSPAVKAAVDRKAKAKFGMAKGGVVGGTDPQTEGAKPPLRGRIKPKLGRAARVAKFEQDNGDEEI